MVRAPLAAEDMVNVALFQGYGFATTLAQSLIPFPDLAPRFVPYLFRLSLLGHSVSLPRLAKARPARHRLAAQYQARSCQTLPGDSRVVALPYDGCYSRESLPYPASPSLA